VLRRTGQQWTGIPVSVGIATKKTLAKVASRRAKQEPACEGVCILLDEDVTESDQANYQRHQDQEMLRRSNRIEARHETGQNAHHARAHVAEERVIAGPDDDTARLQSRGGGAGAGVGPSCARIWLTLGLKICPIL
jgi:hypothetical protein